MLFTHLIYNMLLLLSEKNYKAIFKTNMKMTLVSLLGFVVLSPMFCIPRFDSREVGRSLSGTEGACERGGQTAALQGTMSSESRSNLGNSTELSENRNSQIKVNQGRNNKNVIF